MTKMTENGLASKICRGQIEIDDRSGMFVVCTDCKTGRQFTVRVVS